MNIEDLQLIVETIYQHNPSAYKRGGDVELLNSHIKAMQHLKEVNKIHYKEYNLTDLDSLSNVILKGFSNSLFIQEALGFGCLKFLSCFCFFRFLGLAVSVA